MLWAILSILAALCWAVVNTVDKYVLTKWVRKPIIPVMILGIVGLVASLLVYLFHGFSELSYFNIFLAFVAGVFYILTAVFYFKAVKIEEISRVIPLFYFGSIFILLLATLFLGEVFTFTKYLGIFLLVTGAVLISSKNFLKLSFGKAFWFMIFGTILGSIGAVLTKYLLGFTDFWTIFGYLRIGAIFPLIPIFYFSFPELIKTTKAHGKKVIAVISLNGTLNFFAVLLITIAISVGYVTLVSALTSVQPFFVLLFAVVLSTFYPKILKEEITKRTMFIKLLAIILMFIGAVLII
ncbi:DMT family transporter [Patescibacteria group bacterium]|nr:DMT family transporter [Patescibacteria group bacterium]